MNPQFWHGIAFSADTIIPILAITQPMTMMARIGMMVSAEKAMPCQNCGFMSGLR